MDTRSRRSTTKEQKIRISRLRKRNAAFLGENPQGSTEGECSNFNKEKESDSVFECSYCDMVSFSQEKVKAHATEHHLKVKKCPATETVCCFCKHEAEDNESLKVHLGVCEMKRIKEVMVAKNVSSSSAPVKKIAVYNKMYKVFECKLCNYKHVSKAAVRRHATILHFLDIPVFSCIYCDMGIADRALFDMHLSVSHRREVVDLSFDCTALSLLNKFLEATIIQRVVAKHEFVLPTEQKETDFSIIDIHSLLKQIETKASERANLKEETKNEKGTKSKTKSDAAPKSFQLAVKDLVDAMHEKGADKSKDSKSSSDALESKSYFTEDDIEDILNKYFKMKSEADEEEPALRILEVYSLNEKDRDSQGEEKSKSSEPRAIKPKLADPDISDKASSKTESVPTVSTASPELSKTDKKEKKGGSVDSEPPSSANTESPDKGRRYNLRKKKKSYVESENDDIDLKDEIDCDSPPDSQVSTDDKSVKSNGSATKKSELKPIVIQPIDEYDDASFSADAVRRGIKRSMTSADPNNSEGKNKKTKTGNTSEVTGSNVTSTSLKQSVPGTGNVSASVKQVAGSLPTVLTTVPPQVMQPQSYMLINGQLLPVVSPVMTPNLQQQMVLPQMQTVPLQIQQLRPSVFNTQTIPQNQGVTVIGNNFQPNLVVNKQLGMTNPGISLATPVTNPIQSVPNLIQLQQPTPTIQSPNFITGAQLSTPLVLPQAGGQPTGGGAPPVQFRLEKNAQGIFSLQPVSAQASPMSTSGNLTQANPVNLHPAGKISLVKQPSSQYFDIGKRYKEGLDDDDIDEESDSDGDLDLEAIPFSSETEPERLGVIVYICGKCHMMRLNKKRMEDHVVMMHFDCGVRQASRRRSIAMSKGSYYSACKLKILRADTDWDIPLYRCRHCHLFHVVEEFVSKHIKSDHVMVAGLTEASRHSLRLPKDLTKIGCNVMCNASFQNLKILGQVQKDQPLWSIRFLSEQMATTSDNAKVDYRRISVKEMIGMATLLGSDRMVDTRKPNVTPIVVQNQQPLLHNVVNPQGQISIINRATTSLVHPHLAVGQGVNSNRNTTGVKIIRLNQNQLKQSSPRGRPRFKKTETIDTEDDEVQPGVKVVGHGCMRCSFKDQSFQVLKQHVIQKHLTIKPYKCNHCDYLSNNVLPMRDHIKKTHGRIIKCTEWDFVKRKTSYSVNVKSMISTYYGSHSQSGKPGEYSASSKSNENAATSSEHVEPDSSCDVENLPMTSEECDSSAESKLAGISAPNILSCFQEDEEGMADTNLLSYGQPAMMQDDEECMDEAANVEGSENTTGDAFVCRLCAYSCDILQRIKSHLMSAHISSDMYPFKCNTCGYEVPSTLRLAQHMLYKHLKTAKKNPPKLARELQNNKVLWPQIVPDQKKYERFQQELDCLFRNCVVRE